MFHTKKKNNDLCTERKEKNISIMLILYTKRRHRSGRHDHEGYNAQNNCVALAERHDEMV
jgi:hypothetical protein